MEPPGVREWRGVVGRAPGAGLIALYLLSWVLNLL